MMQGKGSYFENSQLTAYKKMSILSRVYLITKSITFQ